MSKKRKKKECKNISRNNLILFSFLGLLTVYSVFTAFYSYGKIDREDLITVETRVHDVQMNNFSPCTVAWITFKSDNGQLFCLRTDDLDIEGMTGLKDYNDVLTDTYGNDVLSVSYTKRKAFYPFNLVITFDYDRVAEIKCNGEDIVSLRDFNYSNRDAFIGFLIAAGICLLMIIVFAVLEYIVATVGKGKKRKRKVGKISTCRRRT